jgi:RNA polymerase sigma factor (sigma-70 family)
MASCGVLTRPAISDESLAHGVRDGDDGAFEVLYQRYWEPLRRYAGRLLRDAVEGEDAAQVAFANAYRALRSGQTPLSVRPWLYAIARNAAWGLRSERADAVELSPDLAARDDALAGESAALIDALAQLSERQRVVFTLRELRGATTRETAHVLGLRETQVEQLLFAGRARLAELLLFGDSVSCESVRAVGTAELSRPERRALKRHVHHCAECMSLVGGRLKLGARLLGPVEALRRLLEFGLTASVPAKVGAVTAIAVAVSAPVVIPAVDEPARKPEQQRVVATPRVHHDSVAAVQTHVQAVRLPVLKQVAPQPPRVEPKRIATTAEPAPPAHRAVPPAPAPPVTVAPPPAPTLVVSRPVTRAAASPAPSPTRPAGSGQPVRERTPPAAPTETTPARVERTPVTAAPAPATTTVEAITSAEPAFDSRTGATEPAETRSR